MPLVNTSVRVRHVLSSRTAELEDMRGLFGFCKVVQSSLSQFAVPPAVCVAGPPVSSAVGVSTTILTQSPLASSCCCHQDVIDR